MACGPSKPETEERGGGAGSERSVSVWILSPARRSAGKSGEPARVAPQAPLQVLEDFPPRPLRPAMAGGGGRGRGRVEAAARAGASGRAPATGGARGAGRAARWMDGSASRGLQRPSSHPPGRAARPGARSDPWRTPARSEEDHRLPAPPEGPPEPAPRPRALRGPVQPPTSAAATGRPRPGGWGGGPGAGWRPETARSRGSGRAGGGAGAACPSPPAPGPTGSVLKALRGLHPSTLRAGPRPRGGARRGARGAAPGAAGARTAWGGRRGPSRGWTWSRTWSASRPHPPPPRPRAGRPPHSRTKPLKSAV